MIKLPIPRRRQSYYRSPYSRKPLKSRKISLVWLVLSLPLLILVLELVARLFVGITGQGNEVAGLSPREKAYQPDFQTETQKPIEGLSNGGGLVVTRSPSYGYKLVENQKNEFLQINAQGFRDSEPVPVNKPKNEFRIFVIGGSTAFGQGAEKNEDTISNQLETRLKQRVEQQKRTPNQYRPDVFPFFKPSREKLMQLPPKIQAKQYRVINAAVPGYASGNSLAQFALDIFRYQPDMIVVVNGYEDLILPSNQAKSDIPKVDEFLGDAQGHFRTYLSQSFKHWLDQTYVVKTLDQLVFNPQPSLAQSVLGIDGKSLNQSLPADEKELSLRVKRYQENQKQLLRLAGAANIPVLLVSQPEITGRSLETLSAKEKIIRDQLGSNYLEKMPKAYIKFIQTNQQLGKAYPKNVKVLNFYNFNRNLSEPMFSDNVNLTAKANTILAEQIYYTITTWEKIQIIPQNFYLKD
jgi:hypothetical protein